MEKLSSRGVQRGVKWGLQIKFPTLALTNGMELIVTSAKNL